MSAETESFIEESKRNSTTTKTERIRDFFINEWSGETHREIAEILDVGVGTVSRGRQAAFEEGWEPAELKRSGTKQIELDVIYPDGQECKIKIKNNGRLYLSDEAWAGIIHEASCKNPFEGEIRGLVQSIRLNEDQDVTIATCLTRESKSRFGFTHNEYQVLLLGLANTLEIEGDLIHDFKGLEIPNKFIERSNDIRSE